MNPGLYQPGGWQLINRITLICLARLGYVDPSQLRLPKAHALIRILAPFQ